MPASPRSSKPAPPSRLRELASQLGRAKNYLLGSTMSMGSPASGSYPNSGSGAAPSGASTPDVRPFGGIGFSQQPSYSSGNLFQGATEDRNMKPWAVWLADFNRELNWPTWRAMLSHSRRLFANLGAVHGAVTERARLAVGQAWQPIYTGRNHDKGVKATAWLKQWMKVCDVRGFPYDFQTDLKLMSVALDRDGDFGVVLVNDNPNWPQIQLIPAHRVAARTYTNDTPVADGPFKGYWISNGVISSNVGRAVGFNVLGPTHGTDNGARFDRQYSSFDMLMGYRPEFSDQGRGLPSFYSVLRDLRHMADLRDLEFAAANVQGTESLIVANDTGEAEEPAYDDCAPPPTPQPPANPGCTGPGRGYPDYHPPGEGLDGRAGELSIETLAGGSIRYVRGGSGNDIKAFTTTRPSPAWIGLMDHLERASLAAIGWPKEYALDMQTLGGANTRAILDKCQYSIDERQADLWPVALRIICWAVAWAIKNGILEEDEDWYMWEFQLPEELSVDNGNDRSNDRDDLRAGLTNKRRIFGRRGLSWETETAQREKEVDDLFTRGANIAKKHDVSLDVALAYLETHTPNGNLPDSNVNDTPPADASKPAPAPAKKKGS